MSAPYGFKSCIWSPWQYLQCRGGGDYDNWQTPGMAWARVCRSHVLADGTWRHREVSAEAPADLDAVLDDAAMAMRITHGKD